MQFVFHGVHRAAVSIAYGPKLRFLRVAEKQLPYLSADEFFAADAY